MSANSKSPVAKYSAQQIYRVMKPFDLTAEQAQAVEGASTAAPSLIVAGAGSGKTELMAVRVLWLVANGFARPEQILGLTFTRKAATELSRRIFENLLKLRDTDFWPEDLEYDFTQPNISTYNAYSNSLFRDFALAIGYEPEAALLTEGSAFQLAREVLVRQGAQIDERLLELDKKVDSLVDPILSMAQSMNENLATAAQIEKEISAIFDKVSGLPKKVGTSDFNQFGYISKIVSPLAATSVLAKIAESFQFEKKKLGFVDYSDQVALAEQAVRQLPEVRAREQATYSQILLDEYQDTSFLQARLLKGLFSGCSVYAVGDPNQSIYGWRGASSSNLEDFATEFANEDQQVAQFSLSTSWRNPKSVLDLANQIAAPLNIAPSYQQKPSRVSAVKLEARGSAAEGQIELQFLSDLNAEADFLAEWFKQKTSDQTTSALLVRTRSSMGLFAEKLQAAGLEVEVVGLGGLLELPEITDLVSALRVINSPQSGSSLIRLLAGPRWRIGVKDLERLSELAKYRAKSFDSKLDQQIRQSLATEDAASIVDALDSLIESESAEKTGISAEGLSRMRDAASLFRAMRRQVGTGLVEFVRSVEQELWLDIEVMANPKLKHPMANLNAFASIVANYANSNHRPTLASFLGWLDFANERERFEIPTVAPEKGVVQILTVHSAKGLEWDSVAVANLNDTDFPSMRGAASAWTTAGALPYPLRGDRESLPVWSYESAQSQPEFRDSHEALGEQSKEHKLREEIRLMYVAVTRTKGNLLLTGSYFKPGAKTPKAPSQFILKAADFLNVEIPENQNEANPLELATKQQTWPLDPLGPNYRKLLERAATQVSEKLSETNSSAIGPEAQSTERQINLLLAEREEILRHIGEVELPVRIPASRFKDFVTDISKVAALLQRPMPPKPYAATRAGTLFHDWVEANFAMAGDFEGDTRLGISALQETFKNSRWANQTPLSVEQEIHLTIGAHTFICKLDAVFETDTGVEIIDWKTGKSPVDEDDEQLKSLQLSLYRLAYSRFTNTPIEKIAASFYFVAEDKEVRPKELLGEDELVSLWQKAISSID
jgi:DNA helicase-2/ATP-dependent DNA helicase PcrA